MKCRSPTATQCRNRAPNLEATCEKGACETFSGVNMARGKKLQMMQWATPHVIPLTVFQRVSLEMSRCANWTAVPVKPLYRRWHSADGENLASPEDRLCEAATAPFKGGGGGGKKKQSTAPQKPRSHFVILREAISPALHPATAYSLTLHWGERERGLHLSAFIWAKCRYAATELW